MFNSIYARLNCCGQKTTDFPVCIDIELTNHCNFKCLMCPCGTGVMRRAKGFMDKETFDKIITEIKDTGTALRFIRWGEPLLHKDLLSYIKKVKENGIICHINTNASLLTEDISKKLIDLELNSIKLSFQGVDEHSYEQMRINGDFNQIIQNIKQLHELRGDKEFPYIHAATTTTYESAKQIAIFKEKMNKICDLVTIGKTKLEHIEEDETALNRREKGVLLELKQKQSLQKKRFNTCPEVFGKLSINWNGDVSACCMDYDNKMILGNIHKASLSEIWASPLLESYRKILGEKRFEELELCRECYDYMGIQA